MHSPLHSPPGQLPTMFEIVQKERVPRHLILLLHLLPTSIDRRVRLKYVHILVMCRVLFMCAPQKKLHARTHTCTRHTHTHTHTHTHAHTKHRQIDRQTDIQRHTSKLQTHLPESIAEKQNVVGLCQLTDISFFGDR